jgi:hypothetical protein
MRAWSVAAPVEAAVACAMAERALQQLRTSGDPVLVGRRVQGPAVLLGARQRCGSVVNLPDCLSQRVGVYRRATLGPAAWVRDALWWTLCLPALTTLFADARPETALNRNVRGILRGLARAGVAATYPGRTFLSVRGSPAVLLGYDLLPDGGLVLDAFAGLDAPVFLPEALRAPEEAAIDRTWGRSPVPLGGDAAAVASLLDAVAEGVARSGGREMVPWVDHLPTGASAVTTAQDPVPADMALRGAATVPIGRVEAWGDTKSLWLGGDVYGSVADLDRLAVAIAAGEALPDDLHLEGARVSDFLRCL